MKDLDKHDLEELLTADDVGISEQANIKQVTSQIEEKLESISIYP
jgi:hypothetical protein